MNAEQLAERIAADLVADLGLHESWLKEIQQRTQDRMAAKIEPHITQIFRMAEATIRDQLSRVRV